MFMILYFFNQELSVPEKFVPGTTLDQGDVPFFKTALQVLFLDPFSKGTFLLESTDAFVTTPNRRTFFFPETENFNFGDF